MAGSSADNQELTNSQQGHKTAPCTTVTHMVEKRRLLLPSADPIKTWKGCSIIIFAVIIKFVAEKRCQACLSVLEGGTSVNISRDMEHGGKSQKFCFKMNIQNKL